MSLHRYRRSNALSMQPAIVSDRLAKDDGATAAFGDPVHTLNVLPSGTFTQATLAKRPMATMASGWPAMQFDGLDDGLVALTNLIGPDNVTLFAVIRPTGLGGGSLGRILDWSGAQTKLLAVTSNGRVLLDCGNNQHVQSATNSVPLNASSVVAVTISATGYAVIYVNGEQSGSGQVYMLGAGASTYIGNRAGYDRAFQGMIGHVSIHQRLLSPAEIKRVSNYLMQNRSGNVWSFSVSAGTIDAEVTNAGTVTWRLPDGSTYVGTRLNQSVTAGQINCYATFSNSGSYLYVRSGTAFNPLRLSDLPVGLKSLVVIGGVYCVGLLADLPRGLTNTAYLYSLGTNSVITGSLADLPRGLTNTVHLYSLGTNSVITGSLADLPRGLTNAVSIANLGTSSAITGQVSSAVGAVVNAISIFGTGLQGVNGSIQSSQLTTSANRVELFNCNFSPTDTDNNIIALNTALGEGTGAAPRTAVFETNRTSASDAAVAALAAKGWSVTFA